MSKIRQHTFYLKNNSNLLFADIYNNKKTYKVNMDDISIEPDNNLIPIKKYKASDSNTLNNNENIDNENNLSTKDKLFIKNKLNLLTKNELFKIFNFIDEAKIKYTENQNGIFINSNDIDNNTLLKIKEYIKTITENRSINKSFILNNNINEQPHNNIKLSNYEKSIIKKNNYLIEQKTFKNETTNTNWFIKQ